MKPRCIQGSLKDALHIAARTISESSIFFGNICVEDVRIVHNKYWKKKESSDKQLQLTTWSSWCLIDWAT